MATIFNSNPKTTTTLDLSSARITWGTGGGATDNGGDVALFLTQITITYAQASQAYYNLQGNQKVLIKGAPEGTLVCRGIIAADANGLEEFLEAVSKTCKDPEADEVGMTLTPTTGCKTGTSMYAYDLHGVDMTRMDITLQAGQTGVAVLEGAFQMSFTTMEMRKAS